MARFEQTRRGGWALLCTLSMMLTAGACATSSAGESDGAVVIDATPVSYDAMFCENLVCPGFTFCNSSGVCEAFPPCNYPQPVDAGVSDASSGVLFDASPNVDPPPPLCDDGFTCTNDVCLPDDVDFDGDGYNANVDCDENNVEVNPGAIEICNLIDDDCVNGVDDGDSAFLCTTIDTGDVCNAGTCECSPGTFDLDSAIPNCECTASPALDQGIDCASAINLGTLSDTGQMQMVMGNIVPEDRVVWYRFTAQDTADTACDNFHVRAQFQNNPDGAFAMRVTRGACSNPPEGGGDYTDYSWATDFRSTISGVLTGECPCTSSGSPMTNISTCNDNTTVYFVAVKRVPGSTLTCDSFTLELSNGVYDTP